MTGVAKGEDVAATPSPGDSVPFTHPMAATTNDIKKRAGLIATLALAFEAMEDSFILSLHFRKARKGTTLPSSSS